MRQTDTKSVKSEDVIIVKKLRDYSNEAFFVKKAEDAKSYLKKHSLFDELTKKK